MNEAWGILNDAALKVLQLKMKTRVSQGFDTLLLQDVNEVLTIANMKTVKPDKELEVI